LCCVSKAAIGLNHSARYAALTCENEGLNQIPEPVDGGTELVAGTRVSSRGLKIKIEMAARVDFRHQQLFLGALIPMN
jgi:hypothetical protein